MIASSLLNEGYLQPAGDISKNAADGTAENPFLDNADAFYYFVSDKSYSFTLPVMGTALARCSVGFLLYSHMCEKGPSLSESC